MSAGKGGSKSRSGKSGNKLRIQERARRRKLIVRLFVLVLVTIAGCAIFWVWVTRPVPRPKQAIRLALPAHSSILQIGRILQREGVVRNSIGFAIAAKISGKSAGLKSGYYRFSGNLTIDSIIDRLNAGPNDSQSDLTRVTIPEGYTLDQIGALLERKGTMTAAQFAAVTHNIGPDSGLTANFPLPHDSLEGYLFPDTYGFLPHATPVQIVNEMLQNFGRRFYEPYQHEVDASPGGLGPLVIKASLIEREARIQADRPRIAGVIENRLRKGMRLQIDATVLYGIAHKTRVLDGDLKRDSLYNTYLHPGLPAGPIANPGINSLAAALHPESSPYLFYVALPSGYSIFSTTFAEHEAAVKQSRAEWKRSGQRYTSPGAVN